jgi:type II secretory pathway component PulF
VAKAVREGAALSASLDRVKGFPAAITRLVAVGETSGALGPMLIRSGTLEEATAVRRIEAIGRMAGPILIIVLGGMVGTLMAGLLSGISDLGETALR